MSKLGKAERDFVLGSTFLKVLLYPAYHSTDFEVHRNWLAITKSLPLKDWYYEATSEWTLDYPPFFAYFERALSIVAYLINPEITAISQRPVATWSVVAFQRTSVILSEIVLLIAVYRFMRPGDVISRILGASLFLHPGLLIVDSIHFQYNGMMLGMLLLSLSYARDAKLAVCALIFAVLLNFKHIFVYLAPPFIVYLFRIHCFTPHGGFQAHRLVQLALIVAGTCLVSFGPFIVLGGVSQLPQILSRLFPFQRGLNHAYWAANIWAIYTAADRVLVRYMLMRGVPVAEEAIHSSSRGLVGNITFGVLPEITAAHCFAITITINVVFCIKLWRSPSYVRLVQALTLSAFTSFLFGFHVHEKAILLVLFPLSTIASVDYRHFRIFTISTIAGLCALFPLLIHSAETPLKLLYTAIWLAVTLPLLSRHVYKPTPTNASMLLSLLENAYLCGFLLLLLFVSVLHPWYSLRSTRATLAKALDTPEVTPVLEFLPLMATSVYCAIGTSWSYVKLSWLYLTT